MLLLRVRIDAEEQTAFRRAAELSGLKMSAWVRMCARQEATKQCVAAGIAVPWLPSQARDE